MFREQAGDGVADPLLQDLLGQVVGDREDGGAVEQTDGPGESHEGALLRSHAH